VGLLARRLYGKYIAAPWLHLEKRVNEIEAGVYENAIEDLMNLSDDDIKQLYNTREIEK
jgi:hypothetical protein